MEHVFYSLVEILSFVLIVAFAFSIIEIYLHVHLKYFDNKLFALVLPLAVPAVLLLFAGILLSAGIVVATPSTSNWIAVGFSILVAEIIMVFVFKYLIMGKYSVPLLFLTPALLGILLLILYPLIFQAYLSFHDLKLTTIKTWIETGELPFVGLAQYKKVFTTSLLSDVSFVGLFGRTALWTILNVFVHVVGGFALALLLNKNIKFKGIYRTLLVIPWAMPQVIAVLALRGEFHAQYGFINIMLEYIGIGPVSWLSQHPFLTCFLINFWLGIPFMMVIILGGLQSIPFSFYEAASIDGATSFQKFRHITLPMVRPVVAPAATLGAIWTFNNINVIYLVTGQAGGIEDADILVSALYKAAFTFYRYSFSAAFAFIIFGILLVSAVLWLKITRATESAYE